MLDDAFTDLIADGFDAAVRIGALASSDHLVARPLRPYCAWRSARRRPTWRQAGHPRSLADLAGHRCLNHLLWPQGMGWPAFEGGPGGWPRQPLAVTNGQALRRAALAGCVASSCSLKCCWRPDIAAGLLVPLLEDATPAPRPRAPALSARPAAFAQAGALRRNHAGKNGGLKTARAAGAWASRASGSDVGLGLVGNRPLRDGNAGASSAINGTWSERWAHSRPVSALACSISNPRT
ncbi:hypothetical protein ACU4GD_28945 [Cupriavidus basilensis]